MKFIAFDLETTGTVPGIDQIVEIGAVKFNQGIVEATFSTLLDPQRVIPEAASAVNGISNDMVMGKPKIDEILEPFTTFCEDLPIVAHNAPFDSQFLSADIKKYEIPGPTGIILDTLSISRKVYPGLANYKLGTLVQHLKIPSGTFHRAEEDASYCGYLFIDILKKIFRPDQAVDIKNLIALTGKPEVKFPVIIRQHKQLNFLDQLS